MFAMHSNMIADANIAALQPEGLPRLVRYSSRRLCLLLILLAALPFSMPVRAQSDQQLSEARSLLIQHDNAAAETAIRGYLRDHPDSADAHFLLGYTLFRQEKAADSLAEYTVAARYRKPGPDDLMTIGSDYVLLKDNQDADLLFMKVTSLQPGNELAWYYLGRARFYENRYDDAIKVFNLCLRLKPQDIPAETNLGLAYMELGRDADAIAAYQQAIDWEKQFSGHDGQPYLDMGLILRKEQRVDQSLPYLERSAELEQSNPEVHFELAKTYEDLHRYKEAEAQLRIVLTIAPNASAVHYILGHVLKAEGRISESNQEFATTSKLNGTHSTKDLANFNFFDLPPANAGASNGPASAPPTGPAPK